jgi:HAD domain in Swiss Army Knife RNA repair proteins
MTEPINKFEKVIFLDIEGVIVTHRSILVQHSPKHGETYHGGELGWHRFIDKTAMGLVYLLARDFKAQIVLTSTLRDKPETHTGLCAVKPHWLDDPYDLLSQEVTTHLRTREDEIKKFIALHKVEKFVVIDDRKLTIDKFVWCNAYDGFSYDCYQQSKMFLADDLTTVKHEAIYL